MTWIVMGGQYYVTGDEAYDADSTLCASRRERAASCGKP